MTDTAIATAQSRAKQYEVRGTDPLVAGHIPGAIENLVSLGSASDINSLYDLKSTTFQAFEATSFDDSRSKWEHLRANMYSNGGVGVSVANINGTYWMVIVLGQTGTPIPNPNDPTTLQANLDKAQAEQVAAQTASDNAKAKLTQASADYATALDAKTQAEKILNDAMATPLQTQVAENNLRLANIALKNAQERQADAQAAVDNFTADLATKKAKLDEAKAALDAARGDQAAKAEVLETAASVLAKQTEILNSLNTEKANLLAEKDRLVEEAKALATELDGYMKAPAILAEAKAKLTEKEATLADKLAEAKVAQEKLEALNVKLAEEKAKLAELQSEYDKLKDLEDKAKENVIATLPDGTVVTKLDTSKAITVAKSKDRETKVGVTVTPQGITYSRVARAKALPQTGEQESLVALFGVAVLSSLGLAGARRNRRG